MNKADILNIIYEVVGYPRNLTNKSSTIVKAINEAASNALKINDATTSPTDTWSSDKINNEIGKVDVSEIDDNTTAADSTWSSNKISTELASVGGGGGGSTEYMMAIWAEESAALTANAFEWAFGNGGNTPNNQGIYIYVPSGWKCEIVALSSTSTSTTVADVSLVKTNTITGMPSVSISGGTGFNDSFTPVEFINGDILNFRTLSVANGGALTTVTAWLKYTKL